MSGDNLYCEVTTENNFPTGAGLASSASGFAALTVAANQMFELALEQSDLSRIARRHSGSAGRSIYGGFVEMPLSTDEETAKPLLAKDEWPLVTLIAITSRSKKEIGSTQGMTLSKQTSDYYSSWVESADRDFDEAKDECARAAEAQGLHYVPSFHPDLVKGVANALA